MLRQNIPVDSYDQVVENVKRFNAAIDDEEPIVKRVGSFHQWYYLPELDMFGPSKFIGYRGMDATFYMKGHGIPKVRRSKNGGRTEDVLSEWFTVLETADSRWPLLDDRLVKRFPKGKRPRNPHWLNVPKGW